MSILLSRRKTDTWEFMFDRKIEESLVTWSQNVHHVCYADERTYEENAILLRYNNWLRMFLQYHSESSSMIFVDKTNTMDMDEIREKLIFWKWITLRNASEWCSRIQILMQSSVGRCENLQIRWRRSYGFQHCSVSNGMWDLKMQCSLSSIQLLISSSTMRFWKVMNQFGVHGYNVWKKFKG